jgi:hypothetical protein
MKKTNRDLLVVFKQELMSESAIKEEMDSLGDLLSPIERVDSLAICHELIDLNTYKQYNNHLIVKTTIRQQTLKPFVFLYCKN